MTISEVGIELGFFFGNLEGKKYVKLEGLSPVDSL